MNQKIICILFFSFWILISSCGFNRYYSQTPEVYPFDSGRQVKSFCDVGVMSLSTGLSYSFKKHFYASASLFGKGTFGLPLYVFDGGNSHSAGACVSGALGYFNKINDFANWNISGGFTYTKMDLSLKITDVNSKFGGYMQNTEHWYNSYFIQPAIYTTSHDGDILLACKINLLQNTSNTPEKIHGIDTRYGLLIEPCFMNALNNNQTIWTGVCLHLSAFEETSELNRLNFIVRIYPDFDKM